MKERASPRHANSSTPAQDFSSRCCCCYLYRLCYLYSVCCSAIRCLRGMKRYRKKAVWSRNGAIVVLKLQLGGLIHFRHIVISDAPLKPVLAVAWRPGGGDISEAVVSDLCVGKQGCRAEGWGERPLLRRLVRSAWGDVGRAPWRRCCSCCCCFVNAWCSHCCGMRSELREFQRRNYPLVRIYRLFN